MEDIILRVVVPQPGVVRTGDRLVADPDQTAGKRAVRDEAWHGFLLSAGLAVIVRSCREMAHQDGFDRQAEPSVQAP